MGQWSQGLTIASKPFALLARPRMRDALARRLMRIVSARRDERCHQSGRSPFSRPGDARMSRFFGVTDGDEFSAAWGEADKYGALSEREWKNVSETHPRYTQAKRRGPTDGTGVDLQVRASPSSSAHNAL